MSNDFSCILVGDWGSGKSTMAATAPKPILFLDVDNKLHKMGNLKALVDKGEIIQWSITEKLSTMNLARLAGTKLEEGKDKFPTPKPKGYQQLSDMIDKLTAGVKEDKTTGDKWIEIEHNGKQVRISTVVLDSYTTVNEHIRYLILAANGAMAMSQPLWGVLLRNFETLNSTLLSLPANIIFICHERWDKDELSGRIEVKPLIEGQMSSKIGKDFEEVYFMKRQIVGKEVKFSCHPWGDSMRQGRTSRALPIEVDPDFSKIYGQG